MQKLIPVLISVGLLGAFSAPLFAGPKVDQQVAGPAADKAKYVVSLRGGHLAMVAPKGSRVNVIVDGVAGPRFDDVVETGGAIDWRPYADMDQNSDQMPRGGPVTFSKDGSRYAYLARLSQEWVLMVDNKESLRIPVAGAVGAVSGIAGMAGNHDIRIEFTGESGKHLLFAKSTYGGYELWVDGQKWPGFYQDAGNGWDAISPLISPDGEHIAYVAQMTADARDNKRVLIVDGKDAGYYAEHLQFTPDSKHLISVSQNPKGQAVLVDGKQFIAARQIVQVYVPPVGNRLITALYHFSKDGLSMEGMFLLVDGKPVEATLTTRDGSISKVIISPDGKHYAAICGKTGNLYVVIDGKKGQEYFNIVDKDVSTLAAGIRFSPDSSKVVYTAYASGGRDQFVIINEEESDAIGGPWFKFSPDGKRLAYGGVVNKGGQITGVLMVDGKSVPLPPGWVVNSPTFTFSQESGHYAFAAGSGMYNKVVFLDGKNTEIAGEFIFSPDGRHLAIKGGGGPGPEKKQGLFVDGQIVFQPNSSYQDLVYCAFSPDSQHLFWEQREPAVGAKAAPGVQERFICVDGVPAPETRLVDPVSVATGGESRRFMDSGRNDGQYWQTPRRWHVNPPAKLVSLAPDDDGMKRFNVTPPPDTSLDTMIAEAIEAPKRAAAKAAEEKKKADEDKAAKKAKADKDAADAAAKAKADYDAQVAAQAKARADAQAKAKADYDARIAKQKADYDAAMAKRKADADAAAAAARKK
jgi:Tol biopolymer transport system component